MRVEICRGLFPATRYWHEFIRPWDLPDKLAADVRKEGEALVSLEDTAQHYKREPMPNTHHSQVVVPQDAGFRVMHLRRFSVQQLHL